MFEKALNLPVLMTGMRYQFANKIGQVKCYSKKEMKEKGMEKEKTYSEKHRQYPDCMQRLNDIECGDNVLIKQKKEAYSMTECKNGFFSY